MQIWQESGKKTSNFTLNLYIVIASSQYTVIVYLISLHDYYITPAFQAEDIITSVLTVSNLNHSLQVHKYLFNNHNIEP